MNGPIRADEFEPMKLIAVTERLRAWSSISEDAALDQIYEDVKWLLNSHLYYYQTLERVYRESLYTKEGDCEVTWRERAEDLQERLDRVSDVLELIAAPARPDGTYNRDRRACELLAKETLENL
jgi:hypothetical protein